ncbi:MAG: NADH-dependent [FeFe] hydrogenase, group A6 [Bacilli bacterium]
MGLVNIKIEGQAYQVDSSLTILEAARSCGYDIPTLCTFKNGRCSLASCRVCLVAVKGARGLVASCVYPVNEGMEISISDVKAVEARRTSVELLLSNHNKNCQQCVKNGKCELLEVAKLVGARDDMYEGVKTPSTLDELAPGLIRDTSKCILCGRCIEACKDTQGIGILGFEKRGFNTIVAPAGNRSFATTPCMQCGQCVAVCPTGALSEHSEIDKLDKAFKEGKTVIVQTAPAVRAAIAEEFGERIGTSGTAKMIAALHRLGFYRVFDTNFGADLTIMEEANELVKRLTSLDGVIPMITSCSPGWINYCEYFYPELIPHLSTCKSPHEMMGAIIKTYFAERHNLNPDNIVTVSIMPCTAKKFEKEREANKTDGRADVDIVLTTREVARIIKRAGIAWNKLPTNETFDQDLLGDYSGAGVIFGVTGGVMEAAVRTAYHILTGKELEPISFTPIRGLEGIKHADVTIAGMKISIAVASGMNNAKILLEDIKENKSKYQFIEIMGCPGGCIAGGGQPFVKKMFLPNEADNILETYKALRAEVLYKEDEGRPIRRSHANPDIIKLYDEYLGEPNGERAHHLLHTSFDANRKKFPTK